MKHNVSILGQEFVLFDEDKSSTIELVKKEFLSTAYNLFFNAIQTTQNPKIVLDVGAHVGIFSHLMAKKFPDAKVYAIEATKRNFANLEKSIDWNHLPNIEAHNYMIWRDSNITALLMAEDNTGSASIGNYEHCVPVEVGECLNLNELFKFLSLTEEKGSVVIKMDIERAEYEVLSQFKYWDAIDKLLLEVHWSSLPPTPSTICDALNLIGFLMHKLPLNKVFATMPFDSAFHAGAYLPIF